jgi:hypothetical protein
MMPQPAKLNVHQQRRFYKEAVERTLVQFYEQPKEAARQTVESWWKRLIPSRSYKTLLFMHDEPMNTAAALLRRDVIPITPTIAPRYIKMLDASRVSAIERRLNPEPAKFPAVRSERMEVPQGYHAFMPPIPSSGMELPPSIEGTQRTRSAVKKESFRAPRPAVKKAAKKAAKKSPSKRATRRR